MNNRARHGLTTLVNNLPTDRRWLMHGQNQVFRRAFWTRNHRTVGAFVQIALPVNLPQVALAFRSKRPGSCRDRLDCELTIGTGSRVQLARRAVVSRRYNMNLAQGSAGHAVHGRTRNPVAASPTHLLLPRDAHRQTPDYHAQNRQPSYFHFGSSDRGNNRTVASPPRSSLRLLSANPNTPRATYPTAAGRLQDSGTSSAIASVFAAAGESILPLTVPLSLRRTISIGGRPPSPIAISWVARRSVSPARWAAFDVERKVGIHPA